MFLAGSSTSYFMSLRMANIWGERRGVTGSAALGGGTTLVCGTTLGVSTLGGGTLVGVTVGEITKVTNGIGLGVWLGGGGSVGF